jgi:hypothetical protein
MATDLIPQFAIYNNTSGGITYQWQSDGRCHVYGTATGTGWNNLAMGNIGGTPLVVGRTYRLIYSTSDTNVQIRCYFYTDNTWSTLISSFATTTDRDFTVPAGTGAVILRIWHPGGNVVINTYVKPEMYDITYTDVDADCDMMQQVLGWPNADFYTIWLQFSGGLPWDGQSCSEIACCISYLAGNVSKIYVSNYAEGMARLYQANGRFGTTPSRGAFIWFDYDHDGIPDHTGRVYDVSNGIITTVEGNVYSYVAQFTYSVNDPSIYGYGYPNYDFDPVPVPPGPDPGGNQGTYDRIRRRRAERFY